MTGYQYGAGNGFTPNVVLEYTANAVNPFTIWVNGYGGLINALGHSQFGVQGEVILRPDSGYLVSLNRFRVAGWAGDRQGRVLVRAEDGSVLLDTGSILVPGTPGSSLTLLDGESPIVSSGTLRIVLQNFGDLGLDDVDFDQLPDADLDGVDTPDDNCPVFANPGQEDTDRDGRGDACECTDQNGDGLNTVSDLVAINVAIFNPSLATPLCDGNNDGRCDVNDIIAANLEIFSPTSTSTCSRQPSLGP